MAQANGFQFTITGTDPPGVKVPLPQNEATNIELATGEELQPLFARLEIVEDESNDIIRAKSAKPSFQNDIDKDLATIDVSGLFGASPTSQADLTTPLTVLRSFPSGEVDSLDRVTIVFSKSMTSTLTPNAKLSAKAPLGITMNPAIEGVWQWVSSRTLCFTPAQVPGSTIFSVQIDNQLKALDGTSLASPYMFSFSTSTLEIQECYPVAWDDADLQPIILLIFNQRIDPHALITRMKLKSGAIFKEEYPIDALPNTDISKASLSIQTAAKAAKPDTWMLIQPRDKLPPATKLTLYLEAGLPSLEGPLTSKYEMKRHIRTRKPFKLRATTRRFVRDSLTLYFRNEIDPSTFSPANFTLLPSVSGYSVKLDSRKVLVHGKFEFGITYRLTIAGSLADKFKQPLGRDIVVEFTPIKDSQSIEILGCVSSAPSERGFLICPPYGDPQIHVATINLSQIQIAVRLVDPNKDLPIYLKHQTKLNKLGHETLGTLIDHRFIDIPQKKTNERVVTAINLKQYVEQTGGVGHLVVYFGPGKDKIKSQWKGYSPVYTWVQITKIGVAAFADAGQMVFWTTQLADGSPISAKVCLRRYYDNSGEIQTNNQGVGKIKATPNSYVSHATASVGQDTAILRILPQVLPPLEEQLVWHVFDDRHMYKPLETVTVKGYVRNLVPSNDKATYTLEHLTTENKDKFTVTYSCYDGREVEFISNATVSLDRGSFSFTFTVPKDANLGTAYIKLEIEGKQQTHKHKFEIQEFRRPEFNVSVICHAPDKPLVKKGEVVFSAKAEYFSGGPVSNATAGWTVSATRFSFKPPNWASWTFGLASFRTASTQSSVYARKVISATARDVYSSWNHYRRVPSGDASVSETKRLSSQPVDGNGATGCKVTFKGVDKLGCAIKFSAHVNFLHSSGTRIGNNVIASLVVHPSQRYVGIRGISEDKDGPASFYCESSAPFEFLVAVCDLDGNPIDNAQVTIEMSRRFGRYDWNRDQFVYTIDKSSTVHLKPVTTSKDGTAKAKVKFPASGDWLVTATHKHEKDVAQTSIPIYASWSERQPPQSKRTNLPVPLQLTTDKPVYNAGDTAVITVTPSHLPCYGVYTIYGHASLETKSFKVTKKAKTYQIEVPIKAEFAPGLLLTVDTAMEVEEKDGSSTFKRPARASEVIKVPISPDSFRLNVTTEPSKILCRPGETIVVKSKVMYNGEPVKRAQVTLLVVDEAILSLSGYTLPQALNTFVRHFIDQSSFVEVSHSRDDVVVLTPKMLGKKQEEEDAEADEEIASDSEEEETREHAPSDQFSAETLRVAQKKQKSSVLSFSLQEERLSSTALARQNSLSPPKPRSRDSQFWSGEPLKTQGIDNKIILRKVFSALAAFEPLLKTSENGTVEAKVSLPDTLTSYKVWVVAAHKSALFGEAEATVRVELPVSLRPHIPRFFNLGDKNVKVGATLVNNTPNNLKAILGLKSLRNNIKLASGNNLDGKKFEVAPNAQVYVTFEVEANDLGTGKLQFAFTAKFDDKDGQTDSHSDAIEVSAPIWAPITPDTYAVYGEIDQDTEYSTKIHSIVLPKADKMELRVGGLDIAVQSTALASLGDAYFYLERYPFMCSEQISARVLATVALGNLIANLPRMSNEAPPTPDQIKDIVINDLNQLAMRLTRSGQFTFWPDSHSTYTYVSLQCMHAFALAVKHNIVPSSWSDVKAKTYFLRNYSWRLSTIFASKYSARFLTAYSMYIQSIIDGYTDPTKVKKYLNEMKNTLLEEFDSVCLFIMTLGAGNIPSDVAHQAVKCIQSQLIESEGKATTLHDRLIFSSPVRSESLALLALLTIDPKNDLCYKLAKQIQLRQINGRWNNTNASMWAILALNEYFTKKEATEPKYKATMWIGNDSTWTTASNKFKGRTTEVAKLSLPMTKLISAASSTSYKEFGSKKKSKDAVDPSVTVAIEKKGPGALYYRVGVTAAPTVDSSQVSCDYGFELTRRYEPVDSSDADKVTFNKKRNSWKIIKGTKVKVTVLMTISQTRFFVALVDRLPAGLEPVNFALKNAPFTGEEDNASRASMYSWFDHQNIRDSQVEAFANQLLPGTYAFCYVAIAVTPGSFTAPAATAEEMYSPEVYGRTNSLEVVVE